MAQNSRIKSVVSFFVSLTIGLLLAGFGWLHRFDVFDWWRLRGYQAPPAISALADNDTMTSSARRLFYVYHPELDSKVEFSGHCNADEQTIVLGCYVSPSGIYLYDVTDKRLSGVKEVTAAHEMLHAAYARLSSTERTHIDDLTEQAMASIADQRIKDTVESYQSRDPGVVPSELHSILGTEAAKLPSELEQYYARYFTNRAKIVAYADQYESEFTSRKQQIANYDIQLTELKSQIDSAQAELQSQQSSMQNQRQQLNDLLAAKQYDEYNAKVASYNVAIKSFNNLITSTKMLIEQYNQLVQTRNSIATEQQQLLNALDSRWQTQITQ
jgi:hypothetical protein